MANSTPRARSLRRRIESPVLRRTVALLRATFWAAPLLAGCMSILDIDKHYLASKSASGGKASQPDASDADSGTTVATGGTVAGGTGAAGNTAGGTTQLGAGGTTSGAGGTSALAGSADTGAGGDVTVADCSVTGCDTGEKCCGSQATTTMKCYAPAPLVGCSPDTCDYCSDPVPNHALASCKGGKCSFTCDPGYMEASGDCVAMTGSGGKGSGGAGGSSSSGGSTGLTHCQRDSDCSVSCGPAGPFPCCMLNDVCGCTFFNIQLGNAPPIGYCLPIPPGIH